MKASDSLVKRSRET